MASEVTVWERVGARTRTEGLMASIESPVTVARYGALTLLAAGISTSAFAVLFLIFSESVAAWATLALAALFFALLLWLILGRTVMDTLAVSRAVLLLSTVNHIIVHVVLGGYANSGFYLSWGVAVILTSSLVLPQAEIVLYSIAYSALAVVAGFLESTLASARPAPDPALSTILIVLMLVGSFIMLLPVFVYFVGKLSEERERSEQLLLQVLPAEVAAELKETGKTKARRFDEVSVLFADTVGFTPLAAQMEPEAVVDKLNEVFTFFDSLVEKYGCEKIHTVGDAYMVAAGLPVPREDHANALAAVALEMLEFDRSGPLSFRIGINSGPAVAGVIGSMKFQYDIWGDTVNTASRMESHGEPGRIQISEATRDLIKDSYQCVPRGPIEVKGKGRLNTWFLEGPLSPAVSFTP